MNNSDNLIFDILLTWGKVFLQKKKFPGFLLKLENRLLYAKNPTTYLQDVIAQVVKEAEAAIKVLSDPTIIGVTPDDDKWYEAEAAFYMLDNVIYLTKAIENLESKFKDLICYFISILMEENFLSELDKQLEHISDLFYGESFSPLRLVGFHEMRKSMLKAIAQEHHYLFPWYDLLSDEEPSVLEMLIAHYHHLSDKDLPETLKKHLSLYLAEIQRDEALETFIRTENALSVALEKTIFVHWSFALLSEARTAGYKRLLPEDVETIGIGKVSRAILTQKFQTSEQRLIMAIAGACFAPEIKEEERIQILLRCEERVKVLSCEGDKLFLQCAEQLKTLDSGKTSANVVAETLLDFWFEQMNLIGSEVADEKKDMALLIEALLSDAYKSESSSSVIEAFIKTIIASAICHRQNKLSLSFSLGDDEDVPIVDVPGLIRIEGKREDNQVKLLIGSESILLETADKTEAEKLNKILSYLDSGEETFYYQILFRTPDDKWQVFPDEPEETDELEITVPGMVSGWFILLLDTDEHKVKESTMNLMEFFEKSSKNFPSTMAMIVEIIS